MARYIFQRLIGMVFVFLGITVMTFVISHMIPGDPARTYAGDNASQAAVDALRHSWGLDRPLYVQYERYVVGLLHGDLGMSIRTQRPVRDDLLTYFPATFELANAAIIVAMGVGIPLGVLAALHRNRILDHVVRLLSLGGISMPIFWLGLLGVALFYYRLHWLPASGRLSPGATPPPTITGMYVVDSLLTGRLATFFDSLRHLILPAVVLGSGGIGLIARLARSSMLETLGQDYVKTARAKGLRESVIIVRHALKNALLPTITIIGVTYGGLLGGAVLTETIFSWPGLGLYAVSSMFAIDFPAIMGVTLVSAVIFSLVNLIVDLLYVFLDPRIQYG